MTIKLKHPEVRHCGNKSIWKTTTTDGRDGYVGKYESWGCKYLSWRGDYCKLFEKELNSEFSRNSDRGVGTDFISKIFRTELCIKQAKKDRDIKIYNLKIKDFNEQKNIILNYIKEARQKAEKYCRVIEKEGYKLYSDDNPKNPEKNYRFRTHSPFVFCVKNNKFCYFLNGICEDNDFICDIKEVRDLIGFNDYCSGKDLFRFGLKLKTLFFRRRKLFTVLKRLESKINSIKFDKLGFKF